MRIKRNDITVSYYVATTSVGSDGMESSTWAKSGSDFGADVQPIGGKFDPALYGINTTPANVKRMFFDSDVTVALGGCIKTTAQNYMIKGLAVWYGHQEAILEPYLVTLP